MDESNDLQKLVSMCNENLLNFTHDLTGEQGSFGEIHIYHHDTLVDSTGVCNNLDTLFEMAIAIIKVYIESNAYKRHQRPHMCDGLTKEPLGERYMRLGKVLEVFYIQICNLRRDERKGLINLKGVKSAGDLLSHGIRIGELSVNIQARDALINSLDDLIDKSFDPATFENLMQSVMNEINGVPDDHKG